MLFICRYLATGSSFRTLGYSFRISDNTVGGIVHDTCKAIWDNLSAIHLKFPSSEDMVNINNDFWTKWKFPNCSGSIDGKHIRINAPAHSGSMYRNYKSFFSIVLQAVVDANYRFIAIDVGAYGKESDGGIFSHSNLSRQLENGALNANQEKVLPGTDIALPHFLVGDEAYPLYTYLMRPYPQRNLGPQEEIFNKRLTNARQVVECAFGILSSKWRLLLKAIEVNPDRADVIIKCICLLHNVIIDEEGIQNMPTETPCQANVNRNIFMTAGEKRSATRAHNIRDALKNYFCRNNN